MVEICSRRTAGPELRARLALVGPELAHGVRAAITTIVPFYLATTMERPELRWVALGGWFGSLADPGGARRSRLGAVLAFLVAGSGAIAIAGVCVTTTVAAALVLGAIVFAASFGAALGASAASVGTVVSLTAAVAAARPPEPVDAAYFAAGVAWAILMSAMAWPVWRHLPARIAIGRVFERLAGYVDAIAAAATPDAWPELGRRHQRAVRAALEQARATMLALRARHTGETPAGANLRLLVGGAEDAFFRVIALAEQAERGEPMPPELAAAFRAIARDLYTRRAGDPVELTGDAPLVRETRAMAQIARDLDHALAPAGPASPPPRASWPRMLRDALSPRGVIFQHAVRVSVVAAVAVAVGRAITPAQPTWVPVTAIAVTQPYLGPTLARASERVVGTLLGAVLTLAVITWVRGPVAVSLVMFPLAVAAVMTRPRSYRLFVLFLTPVFVMVTDLQHLDWHADLARVVDVALGGALALVAALVAPSPERVRLGTLLTGVLDSVASYVKVATAGPGLRPPAPPDGGAAPSTAGHTREAASAARRAMGLALEAAEASLERMLAEPARLHEGAERAMYVVTYGRRLGASITELLEGGGTVPPEIAAYLEAAIDCARTHGRAPPAPPAMTTPAMAQLVHRAALLARTSQEFSSGADEPG